MKRVTVGFGALVGLVLLGLVLALAVLEVGLGRSGPTGVVVASHEYDDSGCWEGECGPDGGYEYDYSSRDRNRNRGRDRGAFSPGPNDDSFNGNTVCLPGSTCYSDRREERG